MNRHDPPKTFGYLVTAVAVAALLIGVAAVAGGQQLQVTIEPKTPADTIVAPTGSKPVLFGFAPSVVEQAGLPMTAPQRSFCVATQAQGDVILVDSIIDRAEPELPACRADLTPLVIRPVCELTYAEHVLWSVAKIRAAILFCGAPPQAFYFSGGRQPKAELKRAEQ